MALATGLPKKPGNIVIVLDERLSREKTNSLTRVINTLRTFTTVELLTGKTTETALLTQLDKANYDLVFLPWHLYFSWSRAEAFWGLTRTSGPTVAGYFCENVPTKEFTEQPDSLRTLLFDFANLQGSEIALLVKSLQKDTLRSGIRPLLDVDAKIYVENWFGAQGLGNRIDSVLGLSEFSDPKWSKRGNSMRICLNALWSLIYEEGPGKGEMGATLFAPKAYFQVACDRDTAVFRLCYSSPSSTPKDFANNYWPNSKTPTSPSQLLMRYADFVRVHTFANSSDLEVVVGFMGSAVSEQAHGQLHTVWVEPLAPHLFTEAAFEAPSPAAPRLRPLPNAMAEPKSALRSIHAALTSETPANPAPSSTEATVIELKSILKRKEETISELKSGGVGTASPLPPPDADSLLEAFQEKYFDARFQIRQLELEIVAMEKRGATPEEFTNIRLKMEALANREQAWIKKLAGTIELLKTARKK
jgi:hypothetical protein